MTSNQIILTVLLASAVAMFCTSFIVSSWWSVLLIGSGAAAIIFGIIAVVKGLTSSA